MAHEIFEVIVIGLVLSVDSFSAALAMGHRPFLKSDALKFAISSGSAEAIVALLGAFAGNQVIARFEAVDHWIAFSLLIAIAFHMSYEGFQSFRSGEQQGEQLQFHGYAKILLVSLATSLDAFGVGIGLGVSHKPLAPYVVSIGFWAFSTTLIGLYVAKKLSAKFGSVMSLFGAVVLVLIAFQMLKI